MSDVSLCVIKNERKGCHLKQKWSCLGLELSHIWMWLVSVCVCVLCLCMHANKQRYLCLPQGRVKLLYVPCLLAELPVFWIIHLHLYPTHILVFLPKGYDQNGPHPLVYPWVLTRIIAFVCWADLTIWIGFSSEIFKTLWSGVLHSAWHKECV